MPYLRLPTGHATIHPSNQRGTGVANVDLARGASLPVIVAGDIDRGGVFATLALPEHVEPGVAVRFTAAGPNSPLLISPSSPAPARR